jgi:hypothetical protein
MWLWCMWYDRVRGWLWEGGGEVGRESLGVGVEGAMVVVRDVVISNQERAEVCP